MADTNYVKQFTVSDGASGTKTVYIKAVALDNSIVSTEIPDSGAVDTKFVTEKAVAEAVAASIIEISESISASSTNKTAAGAKAVWDLVSTIKTITIQKVNSLDDVTDPQSNVIYLVPKTTTKTKNLCDEYIWTGTEFELIGDTQISVAIATEETAGIVKSTATTGAAGKVNVASDGTMSVNGWDNKVDKVTGKGLSTNDYTDDEAEKLAGIAESATKTEINSTSRTITVTNAEGTTTSIVVPETPDDPKPAYGTISIIDSKGSESSASATATITGFKLMASDNVELTAESATTTHDPIVKISATAKLPTYNATNESISLV